MKHKRVLDTLLAVSGTIVFLPILLLLFSSGFRELLFYHFNNALSLASYVDSYASYEVYAEEFQTVADYLGARYADTEKVCLTVLQGGRLRNIGEEEYLSLPQSVTHALVVLLEQDAFPKMSGLDTIHIHQSRIAFCARGGKYALVYSLDESPYFIGVPDESVRVYAKSIGEGWYHVRKISGD